MKVELYQLKLESFNFFNIFILMCTQSNKLIQNYVSKDIIFGILLEVKNIEVDQAFEIRNSNTTNTNECKMCISK